MQFNFYEIVEVPADFLFRDVSNFDNSVEAAQSRGIEVKRRDNLTAPGVGMAWDVIAKIRKRPRNFEVDVIEYDAPEGYTLLISTAIFTVETRVECVAVSQTRSGLSVNFKLAPLNLRGRLLIQSLKLARGRISARTGKAIRDYAQRVKDRYSSSVA